MSGTLPRVPNYSIWTNVNMSSATCLCSCFLLDYWKISIFWRNYGKEKAVRTMPEQCQKTLGDMYRGLNSYDFHTKGDGHKSHCSQQPSRRSKSFSHRKVRPWSWVVRKESPTKHLKLNITLEINDGWKTTLLFLESNFLGAIFNNIIKQHLISIWTFLLQVCKWPTVVDCHFKSHLKHLHRRILQDLPGSTTITTCDLKLTESSVSPSQTQRIFFWWEIWKKCMAGTSIQK